MLLVRRFWTLFTFNGSPPILKLNGNALCECYHPYSLLSSTYSKANGSIAVATSPHLAGAEESFQSVTDAEADQANRE
ncbi:hypothetical protein TNCV_2195521 [Trichonephila clavipes]|uniref:Uncharacterized protein n=1 Tax=Trichonephila clavipes TaxID=2585209 RepID=A0A8X6SLW5_TRICX|nr:hypothetical protein TNCV_2195521 [Trichonephila clavipes]